MAKVNVSGRPWKSEHKPVRKPSQWAVRQQERLERELVKAKERQLKEEKQARHDESVRRLKERRELKAEKERYEKLALVMHKKKVDRIRRREKRNKLLKER